MKTRDTKFKTTAIATALLIAGTSLVPVTSAYAHDRKRAHSHGHHGQVFNQRAHRKFHRHHRAHRIAKRHHRAHVRHHRRNNNGDLIAAGIIGLAVGALIAGESSRHREPVYTPQYTAPYPSDSGYYQNGRYYSQQRVPLSEYGSGDYAGHPTASGGPEVITFNDPGSLEPWTPGWREWCENNYRSFNPSTGTFRGYDGLDHFCVPR